MEQEKNKRGFFAVIPSVALKDKRLTSTDKLILAEIYGLINDEGWCYPSNKHFAEMFGISERQVIRCLEHIKELSYINFFYTNKGFRIIYVSLSMFQENIQESFNKMKSSVSEKDENIIKRIKGEKFISKEEWVKKIKEGKEKKKKKDMTKDSNEYDKDVKQGNDTDVKPPYDINVNREITIKEITNKELTIKNKEFSNFSNSLKVKEHSLINKQPIANENTGKESSVPIRYEMRTSHSGFSRIVGGNKGKRICSNCGQEFDEKELEVLDKWNPALKKIMVCKTCKFKENVIELKKLAFGS
jgi:hypothetical protein